MKELLHSKIIGKGKPLLILHGLLGMGDNWISLARRYASKNFEVHLIDLRNHGKSFHDDEMNYEVMTDDLYYYVTKYQLSDINLIGHSMGGKLLMFFITQYPNLINAPITVDIAPKKYPPHHHFIFDAIKKLNLSHFDNRNQIDKFLSKDIQSAAIRNFLLKNISRNDEKEFYWKPNIYVLKESLNELGEALSPFSTFDKPILFIKGEKSPYITDEDIKIINAHFPENQLITIPKSGHWVHSEQPELFFKTTLNFLLKKS